MSTKDLFKEFSPQEVAEALVLPVSLTPEEKAEADRQLAEHRLRKKKMRTDAESLEFELMRLKLLLEDYIQQDDFVPKYTFGYFLDMYLQLTKKKKKEFAKEIQIHETLLSQILNNRREPSDFILIRLEIHSNNSIPAINWLKLVEKEKEFYFKNDRSLREKESQFVSGKLAVHF